MNTNNERRSYQMTARADAAAATGQRILEACVSLFWERISDQFTLDEVASRAGVTVQTVIRRFGNKEGLFSAAVEMETARIGDQRNKAPIGDVPGAVAILVDHYEEIGLVSMQLLAAEGRTPTVDQVLEQARQAHREWCLRVFEPWVSRWSGKEKRRRTAQIVAICDVYTWKLLHHDAGLTRTETEQAIIEMLAPFTKENF